MNVFKGLVVLFLSICFPLICFADSAQVVNLLTGERARLIDELSIGNSLAVDKKLRDGQVSTFSEISGSPKAPSELVYSLGESVVAPMEFRFRLSNSSPNLGEIEILASTLSPSTGFSTLRREPIRKSSNWQSLRFEESAAKWIIIRLLPDAKNASIELAEIELKGRNGPPQTKYEFKESPAAAFEVISKLQSTVDAKITEDEASLFKDAVDGNLDTWSFAEASLLSSGVRQASQRQVYLKRIDELEQQARKSIEGVDSLFGKGERLLRWMHTGPLKAGYVSEQTDVSIILDSNTYNCVSSATLFNILARRIGIDARAIEVPDHAFSIVYDGTKSADVETTTIGGFNPSRNKGALNELKEKTGFAYIPDRHRSKRREVSEIGLVALTYYNHGVNLSKQGEYYRALLNYFRALSLDPENKSAVKNALSVLGNWSYKLSKEKKFDKSLSVLDVGLELAPNDRTLKHNYKAIWQEKVETVVDSGDTDAALASLNQAYTKTKDKDFLKLQSWIYLKQGETLVKAGEWGKALNVAEEGMKLVDPSAKHELEKWRVGVLLRWSNNAIKEQDFQTAVDVLARGLQAEKRDYRIENSLAYVAQEWSRHISETVGQEAAEEVLQKLVARFPQLRKVKRAAAGFVDRNAQKAINSGDYQSAVKVYEAARIKNPEDSHIKRNEVATWVSWAKKHIDRKEWEEALAIYEKAYAVRPDARVIKQNISYIVQEWSKEVSKKQGLAKSEALVANIATRFPDFKDLQRAKGRNIAIEVQTLTKNEQYTDAEKAIDENRNAFGSERDLNNLIVNLYYYWGKSFSEKGEWAEAVGIYDRALEKFPSNFKLKRNAIATWHAWADTFMKEENWAKAIEVYQKGLKSIPSASLFTRNIKYCESKL